MYHRTTQTIQKIISKQIILKTCVLTSCIDTKQDYNKITTEEFKEKSKVII